MHWQSWLSFYLIVVDQRCLQELYVYVQCYLDSTICQVSIRTQYTIDAIIWLNADQTKMTSNKMETQFMSNPIQTFLFRLSVFAPCADSATRLMDSL
jgi:hypothetical protein